VEEKLGTCSAARQVPLWGAQIPRSTGLSSSVVSLFLFFRYIHSGMLLLVAERGTYGGDGGGGPCAKNNRHFPHAHVSFHYIYRMLLTISTVPLLHLKSVELSMI
jgi:hypothetical protein